MSDAGGTARVLVVDDDPVIFELLAGALEDGGICLTGAKSGIEALALLDGEFEPDLIILDLMMPGMDGSEVLRRVRGLPAFDHVPVILLTARSRSEEVIAGLEAGANDYVTKPFHLAELKARVRSALRLRSLFRELERAREASLQQERLKVLVETTGAVAHTLNQPLTAALLKMEILLRRGVSEDSLREDLEFIHRGMEKVARAVARIRHLTTYRTTPYLEDLEILDLEGEGEE